MRATLFHNPGRGGACFWSRMLRALVVVPDTGATANFVCFRWLEHQNQLLESYGYQRVSTDPPKARFRFGDGRLGEVRLAADIPVGLAGEKRKFAAFARDAAIPA